MYSSLDQVRHVEVSAQSAVCRGACVILLLVLPDTAASLAVPTYSSLPGAPHTLYLNFGGISLDSWNVLYAGTVPAYDTNGDPSTFDSTELSNIQQIWGQVAEAYSPFNVNITTVSPGSTPVAGVWSQIVIWRRTPRAAMVGNAGGVAYIGGFQSGGTEYGTAWAFTNDLINGTPKYTAVAAAHEAGHQFGLDHQRVHASGNLVNEYRASTDGNLTAPIMGNGYYAVRALWSNGTSASATSDQYDTSILASTLGYRPDVGNDDFGHATPSDGKWHSVSAAGVIGQPTENDYFSLTTVAGQARSTSFTIPTAACSTQLVLYSQDHTLLQTIDPGPDSDGAGLRIGRHLQRIPERGHLLPRCDQPWGLRRPGAVYGDGDPCP